MDDRQRWCETNVLPAFESEPGEGRKVEAMRSRKGGQNFSIERILGRVRGGQEGVERLVDQEEDEGQEQELEEGDEEEDDEEEDNREENITHQEYQLKKEHVQIDHLLGLSPKYSALQPDPTSSGRVQPILPRPPPLVPPPPPPTTSTVAPSLFPRASPFSQDPFLLTPLQSQRYSFI